MSAAQLYTGLILKPEPGPSPTFIFEARFRPVNHIYRVRQDMRNCALSKTVMYVGVAAGTRLYHIRNSNHFDQNICLNKHKLRLLVNDNTAKCNVSQEIKKLSRNYPR